MKTGVNNGKMISLNVMITTVFLFVGCSTPRRSPVIVTPTPSVTAPPQTIDCKEELGQRWDGNTCQNAELPTPQTDMTNAECLAAKYNWIGGKCVKPSVSTPAEPTPTQPIGSNCNMKNLKICLAYGKPGEDCYAKNLCRQDLDTVTYSCNLQALNICLAYQGGQACYVKHDCDPKI